MGDWLFLVAVAGLAALLLTLVWRLTAKREDDPRIVEIQARTIERLTDRLMAFTADGREHTKLLTELESMRAANDEHVRWRTLAAADRIHVPKVEEPPVPAIWQEGPQGGV